MAASLPKYVAIKGDNDKYLVFHSDDGKNYLQFSGDNYVKRNSMFETIEVEGPSGGNYVFKFSDQNNKNYILQRNRDEWILACEEGNQAYPPNAIFFVEKKDDSAYTLFNTSNNKYCQRYTDDFRRNCLKAAASSMVPQAKLVVQKVENV